MDDYPRDSNYSIIIRESDIMTKFVILLTDPPYSRPLLGDRIELIQRLAQHQHELILFHYLDGVHLLNSDQFPQNFRNITQMYLKLHKEFPHVPIYACSRCVAARGYLNIQQSNIENSIFIGQKMLPFVKIVSVRRLGEFIQQQYQVIQC